MSIIVHALRGDQLMLTLLACLHNVFYQYLSMLQNYTHHRRITNKINNNNNNSNINNGNYNDNNFTHPGKRKR